MSVDGSWSVPPRRPDPGNLLPATGSSQQARQKDAGDYDHTRTQSDHRPSPVPGCRPDAGNSLPATGSSQEAGQKDVGDYKHTGTQRDHRPSPVPEWTPYNGIKDLTKGDGPNFIHEQISRHASQGGGYGIRMDGGPRRPTLLPSPAPGDVGELSGRSFSPFDTAFLPPPPPPPPPNNAGFAGTSLSHQWDGASYADWWASSTQGGNGQWDRTSYADWRTNSSQGSNGQWDGASYGDWRTGSSQGSNRQWDGAGCDDWRMNSTHTQGYNYDGHSQWDSGQYTHTSCQMPISVTIFNPASDIRDFETLSDHGHRLTVVDPSYSDHNNSTKVIEGSYGLGYGQSKITDNTGKPMGPGSMCHSKASAASPTARLQVPTTAAPSPSVSATPPPPDPKPEKPAPRMSRPHPVPAPAAYVPAARPKAPKTSLSHPVPAPYAPAVPPKAPKTSLSYPVLAPPVPGAPPRAAGKGSSDAGISGGSTANQRSKSYERVRPISDWKTNAMVGHGNTNVKAVPKTPFEEPDKSKNISKPGRQGTELRASHDGADLYDPAKGLSSDEDCRLVVANPEHVMNARSDLIGTQEHVTTPSSGFIGPFGLPGFGGGDVDMREITLFGSFTSTNLPEYSASTNTTRTALMSRRHHFQLPQGIANPGSDTGPHKGRSRFSSGPPSPVQLVPMDIDLDSESTPDGPATNKPGNSATNKPGNSVTNKPGNRATNKSGNSVTNKPGKSATNPANSATNKPANSPTDMRGHSARDNSQLSDDLNKRSGSRANMTAIAETSKIGPVNSYEYLKSFRAGLNAAMSCLREPPKDGPSRISSHYDEAGPGAHSEFEGILGSQGPMENLARSVPNDYGVDRRPHGHAGSQDFASQGPMENLARSASNDCGVDPGADGHGLAGSQDFASLLDTLSHAVGNTSDGAGATPSDTTGFWGGLSRQTSAPAVLQDVTGNQPMGLEGMGNQPMGLEGTGKHQPMGLEGTDNQPMGLESCFEPSTTSAAIQSEESAIKEPMDHKSSAGDQNQKSDMNRTDQKAEEGEELRRMSRSESPDNVKGSSKRSKRSPSRGGKDSPPRSRQGRNFFNVFRRSPSPRSPSPRRCASSRRRGRKRKKSGPSFDRPYDPTRRTPRSIYSTIHGGVTQPIPKKPKPPTGAKAYGVTRPFQLNAPGISFKDILSRHFRRTVSGPGTPGSQSATGTGTGSSQSATGTGTGSSQSATGMENDGSQSATVTVAGGSQSATGTGNSGSQSVTTTGNRGSQSGTVMDNGGSQSVTTTGNRGSQSGTVMDNGVSQSVTTTGNRGSQSATGTENGVNQSATGPSLR